MIILGQLKNLLMLHNPIILVFGMKRYLESVQSIFTVGTVGRVREITGPRLGEAIELLARGGVEAGGLVTKKSI